MIPGSGSSSKEETINADSAKIIEWEDFDHELARLWSLSSALKKSKEKKNSLEQKLESLIQIRVESLNRSNALEDMRQKLSARKLAMRNKIMESKIVAEDLKNHEEQLSIGIRSLLVSGKSLSVACKQLQASNRSLAGERGHVHLKNLLKKLRLRQQYMMTQVSSLYAVNTLAGITVEKNLNSSSSSGRSGISAGPRPYYSESLTVSGLRLSPLTLKKINFFTDKKEVQRSAAALGYVAHAVWLIASYLDVPLRYSLRLGGSRSYIIDYAPSPEHTSDSTYNSLTSSTSKPAGFSLFLEGQDTTRAAYAIFLLNKDLEQLLNFIGVRSLGPHHVLANLKELYKTIQSSEYVDM